VHADVGDGAARPDQRRGGQQRLGVADGLDRDVDARQRYNDVIGDSPV
jgi:hypothetical protein